MHCPGKTQPAAAIAAAGIRTKESSGASMSESEERGPAAGINASGEIEPPAGGNAAAESEPPAVDADHPDWMIETDPLPPLPVLVPP